MVLGEDEIARNEVSVKPLRDERPQQTVARDALVGWLEQCLSRPAAHPNTQEMNNG
ncbi:hypothetical protein D3C83_236890 [compost metagenome]